jgi:hypothetical protein
MEERAAMYNVGVGVTEQRVCSAGIDDQIESAFDVTA